jgi:hypothetical protein
LTDSDPCFAAFVARGAIDFVDPPSAIVAGARDERFARKSWRGDPRGEIV